MPGRCLSSGETSVKSIERLPWLVVKGNTQAGDSKKYYQKGPHHPRLFKGTKKKGRHGLQCRPCPREQ
ncbi:hypothetical protein HRM2_17300 [Desulforapulum autotrophicum HRM2]|uniref:Uncharacterized protein n=1 Tax=Desulforapulum autotrophicum (strain ATCC 43914 / DSM 3382 / VKM B-1955 / HRM2) TaxID=177437 RepID=C0QB37_DESAH|nr:hypothetical protein HRM2_17300 [Desulforapulum autotrophicum HRM2]